jgi:uncharacterized protein YkwD
MLSMINQTRAQNGVGSLQLNLTQSLGTSSCPGAFGHSKAMAQQGQLFHSNPLFNEFCVPFTSLVGQNIGYWSSDNELQDLSNIHSEMMSEPHSPSYCAQSGNHACNILDPTYTQIGIGIYNANGTTWLTEDFIG